MKMTQAQMQQVVDWVNEKLPGGWKCSFCGERKRWKIDPTLFNHLEYDPEYGHFPGQKEIAGIFIFCSHCGHMNLMDVETIGIKNLAPNSE